LLWPKTPGLSSPDATRPHSQPPTPERQCKPKPSDVTDDQSIQQLAERAGRIDHLVSTVSARAGGTLAKLDRSELQRSFDTKVIGPTMLAKYFAPTMAPNGSIVLFSGVNAFKVSVGYLGVAITNGAVGFLARSLTLELGPIRSTPFPQA
jgi:NAD(P)-dependent dehydrogenase (short-subunit alcohol dehydrogenase family)